MKILSHIMHGVFVLLLIGVAVVFLAPVVPIFGDVEIKIVESGSMEPTIMTGALVFVRAQDTYSIGDIITFESASADIPTTHRIVEVYTEGGLSFQTKGDANEEADTEAVLPRDVIGRVVFDVPYAGFVLDFARTPLGFAVLIILPALLIIGDEIEKIWREVRKMRSPKESGLTVEKEVVDERDGRSLKMMEINIPVFTMRKEVVSKDVSVIALSVPEPRAFARDLEWVVAACIAIVFSLCIIALGQMGSTISYFKDIESSLANSIRARFLDFVLNTDGNNFFFVGNTLGDDDGTILSILSPLPGSANLRYTFAVTIATGTNAFCGGIVGEIVDPFSYNGPLKDLSVLAPIPLGPSLRIGITLDEETLYTSGELCEFDLIYRAYDSESSEGGYTDEERVRISFTAPLIPQGDLMFRTITEDVLQEAGEEEHGEDTASSSESESKENDEEDDAVEEQEEAPAFDSVTEESQNSEEIPAYDEVFDEDTDAPIAEEGDVEEIAPEDTESDAKSSDESVTEGSDEPEEKNQDATEGTQETE